MLLWLDEGTAAAEAMIMLYNSRSRQQQKENVLKYFLDVNIYPQSLAILETRAEPLGIELVKGAFEDHDWDQNYFGGMIQYPNNNGEVKSHRIFVEKAHAVNAKVCVAADIMSLTILVPPREWGADVVVGNTQRFGVPMGYGGPHAGYFATKEELKRNIPGRIIGVSKDRRGGTAYRMALQTREQHIRRDKATSNICTAQALLAIMAGMYAVYHGPNGLREIGEEIHKKACFLDSKLKEIGFYKYESILF